MRATLLHRNWTSRVHLPAANAALAFAVVLIASITITQSAQAQTFTILHSFDGTDGSDPFAGLVQATDGHLYGATTYGGANNAGTVFKITPTGTLTTLYSFCPQSGCSDGEFPGVSLIQATDGTFYGTTTQGGTYGDGTVFRITPSGTLTTLHSFNGADGAYPAAVLIQASDGRFYGTTFNGGANDSCDSFGIPGCGTVFSITAGGDLTTLYNFCSQSGCADGTGPFAGLVQATNGNLYGTTAIGGSSDAGAVFEITPSGSLTTLHSFNGTDGWSPQGSLVQGTDGNFYGTTKGGGSSGNGTVFKITPAGTLTELHSFDGTDGIAPEAGLIQATDGNFYGTTNNNYGTVFRITPSGKATTLHSFCSQSHCTDGSFPYAGLTQDTNGKFYGTALGGGTNNLGIIFSLSMGLHAFVETQPTSGKVGAAVKILGTDLTGATSVTFNGTAATFTVVSSSEIATTVPTGATTGKVQVVTPKDTLSSNVKFRVAP
jgi:uncharacterized repeat protein (TIGR03803 family)